MSGREKLNLTKEKRDDMIIAIKKFFREEREEDLGDLASTLILDFVIEKLAPDIYNEGVYDSYKYMSARTEELLEIQKQSRCSRPGGAS